MAKSPQIPIEWDASGSESQQIRDLIKRAKVQGIEITTSNARKIVREHAKQKGR